jgi:hypothetical protein
VKRLGLIAGISGIVLGTLWGSWLLLLPHELPGVRAWLGVVALALLAVGLVVGRSAVAAFLRGRRAQIGLHSLVLVFLVLAIYLLLNFAGARNRFRWDLTEMKQWSLSETTLRVLARLDEDVTLIGFYSADQAREERAAREIYQLYAEASPRISWRIVDPLKDPAEAGRYGVKRPVVTLADAGGDFRWGIGSSQTTVTNLIAAVSGGKRRAVFLQGQGMRSPDDRGREGYREMRRMLEDSLYEVGRRALVPGELLDRRETALVILAGPTETLEDFEVEALNQYLRQGGKVLALVDPLRPDEASPAAGLLGRWGMQLQPGVVAQENEAATPWLVFARSFKDNPEMQDLVRTLEGRRVVFDRPGWLGLIPTEDIRLYRDALAVVNPEEDKVFLAPETYSGRPDPGREALPLPPRGGLPLIACAWRETLHEGKTVAISRLAVVADADFGDNYTLLQNDNRLLLSGLVGWLTEEVLLVEEETGEAKATVAWLDHWRTIATVILVPPVLVALFGTAVVLYRRWR